MKKAILYTLIGGVLCIGQAPTAHAASEPQTLASILISEFQTGGTSDATEEFVEVYNPNDTEVDVTGWQLQYRAASAAANASWPASSTKATFACTSGEADCRVVIPARNRIVLTNTIANIAGALPMSGGFSGTGGQLRLVQPGSPLTVHDLVGYGTAVTAEISPAAAPQNGKSSKRMINNESLPVDTGNNAHDFLAGCGEPSPGQEDAGFIPRTSGCEQPPIVMPPTTSPEPTSPEDPPATQPDDQPNQDAGTPVYLPLVITEVFADPVSPQQDSTDEFIEIYNPNDSAITLQNYRLQTGSDYRYSFTLGDTPLGPHMYLAIPSAVSKLSLANTGSGVRLIDPNGAIVYEAPNYGDAKEGQSWMQDDTGWKWTLAPTPGAVNTLSVPQPKVITNSASTTKKKIPTTKVTKVAVPKQAKAPAAKKAAAEKTTQPYTAQATTAANPQYWLLVPLGTLVAGYAAYEYRHGISKTARSGWAKISGKEPPAN